MKYIKQILAVSISLWLLTGCCWTDHSEVIKEVAVPMAKELEEFYKKEKRFPTRQERDEMLEKMGCEMDGDVCRYKLKDIHIELSTGVNYYSIKMRYKNSYCPLYLKDDGTIDIFCMQKPCIDIGQ